MKILITCLPSHTSLVSESNNVTHNKGATLSLYLLSAVLRRHGHDVRVVDPLYYFENKFFLNYISAFKAIKEMLAGGYDAVAVSTHSFSWSVAKTFVDLVKKADDRIPVILGGIHATYYDRYLLSTTKADYIVRGEGEEAFPQLLAALSHPDKLRAVNGLSYRDKDGNVVRTPDSIRLTSEELSAYPLPDYHLMPKEAYNLIPVETSRGCKLNCLFCSVPFRKGWTPVGKEKVIACVEKINEMYKEGDVGTTVMFTDENFSEDTERAIDIFTSLYKLNYDLKYLMFARIADFLTPGFLRRVPADIIGGINFGVDAGYDECLKTVRKGITVAQVYQCAEMLYKQGMSDKSLFYFLIGYPWEDVKDVERAVHFLGDISLRYNIYCEVTWHLLYPSDLWLAREKYGVTDMDESVFDNPSWEIDMGVFYRSRPRLSAAECEYIESLLDGYRTKGGRINITRRYASYAKDQ